MASTFSMLYEGTSGGGGSIYQPVSEIFEFTNIKAFKEFFSSTQKIAGSKTKLANSLFRKQEYKEAKKEYQEALKHWKELQVNIKKVEEKEPGWFKTNDLIYYLPFVNFVAVIVLSFAQELSLRYVPRYVARNENTFKDKQYRSNSVTKASLIASINEVVNYCEFQIKACDNPKKVLEEGVSCNEALEDATTSLLESMMECADYYLT